MEPAKKCSGTTTLPWGEGENLSVLGVFAQEPLLQGGEGRKARPHPRKKGASPSFASSSIGGEGKGAEHREVRANAGSAAGRKTRPPDHLPFAFPGHLNSGNQEGARAPEPKKSKERRKPVRPREPKGTLERKGKSTGQRGKPRITSRAQGTSPE